MENHDWAPRHELITGRAIRCALRRFNRAATLCPPTSAIRRPATPHSFRADCRAFLLTHHKTPFDPHESGRHSLP